MGCIPEMRHIIEKMTKISRIREYEIERIKNLLQNKTLRDVERFNLNVYLKSLLKDGKK